MSGFLPIPDEQRFVSAPGGARLRVRRFGAGPPLLLLNGLVSSEAHWGALVRHFARRRSVLFWDYRGHGGAPPPDDLDTLTVTRFADDAHEVLAAFGHAAAAVVGLSFGVQVALELARRHPADAAALVLVCGTAGHPLDRVSAAPRVRAIASSVMRRFASGGRVPGALLGALKLGVMRELAYVSGGAHRSLCPREVLDGVFAHTAAMDPRVVGRVVASYFAHSAWDFLPSLRAPTLVLAADRDQLTPVACAERMVRAIEGGGGRATLRTWSGHSHLLQVERPDEVHAEIERFLDGT